MPTSSDSKRGKHWAYQVPPLSALAALEAIARLGSFAEAAEELNRTPSALSHAVRDLEKRTGAQLLERGGGRVTLTALGRQYMEDVREAIDALKRSMRTLRLHNDSPTVRISAPPLIVATLLIPNLSTFERDNPPFRLSIETSEHIVDFDSDDVDVAIRAAGALGPRLIAEPLPRIARVPVCAPQLAATERLSEPPHLARAPLIGIEQVPDAWPGFLEQVGVEGAAGADELAFTSTVSALEAARRGLGVALGLYPLICSYPGYGSELVRVTAAVQTDVAAYRMVFREVAADTEKVRRVRTWLLAAFNDLFARYPLETLRPAHPA